MVGFVMMWWSHRRLCWDCHYCFPFFDPFWETFHIWQSCFDKTRKSAKKAHFVNPHQNDKDELYSKAYFSNVSKNSKISIPSPGDVFFPMNSITPLENKLFLIISLLSKSSKKQGWICPWPLCMWGNNVTHARIFYSLAILPLRDKQVWGVLKMIKVRINLFLKLIARFLS